MIELGKVQTLQVVKQTDFGVYVGESQEEKVLLPKKYVPEGTELGDMLTVFIYRDSKDRLIATTQMPYVTIGETAVLRVKEMSKIGAFLDWGPEKDLFLPFKEQIKRIQPEDEILVAVYADKSNRLCATMKVYPYLRTDGDFTKEQRVSAIVYQLNENYGAFAAVDGVYQGLIPAKELHEKLAVGDRVQARITGIREDGKLYLSIREPVYRQMGDDASKILGILAGMGGVLPYTDKAAPETIERDFFMSKNAFKRGVGKLLKEGKISITENSIRLVQGENDRSVLYRRKRDYGAPAQSGRGRQEESV